MVLLPYIACVVNIVQTQQSSLYLTTLYVGIQYSNCFGDVAARDETILQYIDTLQYLLLQYNTIWLQDDINILHIAIYCDILQCLWS